MPTKNIKNKLRLGIPARSLRLQVLDLLEKAGFAVNVSDSGHKITIDDPEIDCFFSKTQELAEWVENGMLDVAIVQKARLLEQNIKVKEISDFKFGNSTWDYTRVVVAVPQTSRFKTLQDLENQEVLSRLPNLTKKFFEQQSIKVKVTCVNYPGEAKAEIFNKPLVDFTDTGRTLREHNLRIIGEIMQTSPRLIMNNEAFKNNWKRQKAENLALLLKAARSAMDMVGLMLHAKSDIMADLLKILPAMKKPTVTQLRGENIFDVLTVLNKKQLRELLPRLKKIGCADIVEFPLEKVVF